MDDNVRTVWSYVLYFIRPLYFRPDLYIRITSILEYPYIRSYLYEVVFGTIFHRSFGLFHFRVLSSRTCLPLKLKDDSRRHFSSRVASVNISLMSSLLFSFVRPLPPPRFASHGRFCCVVCVLGKYIVMHRNDNYMGT